MNRKVDKTKEPPTNTRHFIRFIRERAIKRAYEKNYNKYVVGIYKGVPLHKFLYVVMRNEWFGDFIDCAFEWDETDEGNDFWLKISDEWISKAYKLKLA